MWSGVIESNHPKSGSTVYSDWHICNGVNGTPDLRDRFIVGSGNSYTSGTRGGVNSVTLTQSQMPSHSHGMNSGGAHYHEISQAGNNNAHEAIHAYFTNNAGIQGADIGGDHQGNEQFDLAFANYSNHKVNSGAHTHTINPTGGGQAHENRPPYYALAFIIIRIS